MTTILDIARDIARPGIEPPTPMWRSTLALWYGLPYAPEDIDRLVRATGRSRRWLESRAAGGQPFSELWCRVGRRGRKSSIAGLICVYEALWGGHERFLMPGERGLIACVSHSAAGSAVVARFAQSYLNALGFRHSGSRIGSVPIEVIEGASFDLAIFPATQKSPRGWPIPVAVLDEPAHLPIEDGDEEYRDSDQAIIGALRPAQAQFPEAKLVGISTPLGCSGVFHETVEAALGNDDETKILAVCGPTWEWSSDITEARTIELARGDMDIHSREYGAIPSTTEGLAFVPDDVAAMFELRPEHFLPNQPVMVIDAAESADTFAYMVCRWMDPDPTPHRQMTYAPAAAGFGPGITTGPARDVNGCEIMVPIAPRQVLWVERIGGFDGPSVRRLGMDRVVQELCSIANGYGCTQALGDDRAGPYLGALFSQRGQKFSWYFYAGHKHDAVVLVRAWMRDRQVIVSPADSLGAQQLRQQCLRYRRFVSGGRDPFTYGQRGVRDDFACLLITLAVSINRAGEERAQPARPIEGAPKIVAVGGRHVASGR